MELTTITRRVAEMCAVDASSVEPDPRFVGAAGWRAEAGEAALAREQEAAATRAAAPAAATAADAPRDRDARRPRPRAGGRGESAGRPERLRHAPDPRRAVRRRRPRPRDRARRLRRPGVLGRPAAGGADRPVAGRRPRARPAISRSAIAPARTTFSGAARSPPADAGREAVAVLKPLMEARGVAKLGHDVKFGAQVLARRGVPSRRSTTPC